MVHRAGGAFRRCFIVVGVPLQGESGGGVPGEGLQVADGLTALGEQGQAAMPEIVEPDRGEAGPHEQRLEVPIHDVLSSDGTAVIRGEHEAVALLL